MTPIISDSPAHSTGIDALWEKPTFELDVSTQQVSLELIQSLSPELKDAALLRLCRVVESKPTLVESFALNQVLYRTLTGNSFIESAESVAARTGHDRKTILKGLNQAVEQNILEENRRLGTSNEYFFKPVEEWLPQLPVRIKDTQKIGGDNLVQFPTEVNVDIVKTSPVHETDYHETDANMLLFNGLLEQTTTSVSVPVEDTQKSSYWKYVGQGIPRVYMPPELDADTGMKIESIHSATKEPRQFIIKNAVDLLYNQLEIPSIVELEQQNVTLSTIPDDVVQALEAAGIHLTLGVAERLWLKYSDSFSSAIAYTVAQDKAGKIKQSLEGFFRKSLEEGWSFNKPQRNKDLGQTVLTRTLTTEQQQWYKWACANGVCDGRPVADLAPSWNGELGVFVFVPTSNPALSPWVMKPISVAMREFPIS